MKAKVHASWPAEAWALVGLGVFTVFVLFQMFLSASMMGGGDDMPPAVGELFRRGWIDNALPGFLLVFAILGVAAIYLVIRVDGYYYVKPERVAAVILAVVPREKGADLIHYIDTKGERRTVALGFPADSSLVAGDVGVLVTRLERAIAFLRDDTEDQGH